MSSHAESEEKLAKLPPEAIWAERYEQIAAVIPHERLERYVPGGFHPVTLGDTFCDGRYTICHKLGHGGYSTVWLARDHQEERLVSIKIKQAYISTEQLDEDPDVRALRMLETHYGKNKQIKPRRFAKMLHCFQHSGPNGTHNCIVTDLLGPSISQALKNFAELRVYLTFSNDKVWDSDKAWDDDAFPGADEWTFQPKAILRASQQLVEALADIHQGGIAHGDISTNNVVFTCNLALQDDEDFWGTIGKVVTAEFTGKEPQSAHIPKRLVASARWPGWVDNAWEDICLVDWGESFPTDETRSNLAQPADLRPPETYFISSFDYRHDLWRAGSVIYELFFQRWPFWGGFSRVEYIEALVEMVGPLPSKWHERWREMVEDDKRVKQTRPPKKSLDKCFEPRLNNLVAIFEASECYSDYQQKDEEYQGMKSLLPVMKGLLRHEPDKRMSAQEAASSIEWVDDWDGDGSQGGGSEEDGSKGLGSADVGSNAEE